MQNTKSETLLKLADSIRGLEYTPLADKLHLYISSGIKDLDESLPGGGLPAGSLIEVLAGEAAGSFSFCLMLARKAISAKPAWAVVDPGGCFYPPAAQQYDISKLILTRPPARHATWAFTQLLGCPDVSASFLTTASLNADLDNMSYRRLQLAAEHGQGLGFVMRPKEAARKPCWAALRLLFERGENGGGEVTLLHVRGGRSGARLKQQGIGFRVQGLGDGMRQPSLTPEP
ncbi:MAG TPA: hypothetical protein VGP72_26205 [Planctomycetota bacterium]